MEAHINPRCFLCESSILIGLEFGNVGFSGGRKTLGAKRELTTNSAKASVISSLMVKRKEKMFCSMKNATKMS